MNRIYRFIRMDANWPAMALICVVVAIIWSGIWVRSSDGADCPPGGT